jgi:CheY-like chemotaxis protein
MLIRYSWSIVNQLGGKIHIRSELGKGTDVEVTLPVEAAIEPPAANARPGDPTRVSADAEDPITALRERAAGKSVFISRSDGYKHETSWPKDISWGCIEKYCSEWFGFQIKTITVDESIATDLIITDQHDYCGNSPATRPIDNQEPSIVQRTLIIHDDMICSESPGCKQRHQLVGNISNPIGPFKLARCILSLLDQDISKVITRSRGNQADAGTQTPLAPPHEPLAVNNNAMADYGFTQTKPLSSTPESQISQPPSIKKESDVGISSLRKQDDDGMDQALATIKAMSVTLRQPPSPKPTQPRTVSLSPASANSLNVPESPKVPSFRTETATGLHILAVDDNVLNLQLLHRYLLKRKSDTIVTARNGIEAVTAVRTAEAGKGFDIIFMDLSMPDMDGFEATRLIRSFETSLAHRSISEDIKLRIEGGEEDNGLKLEVMKGSGWSRSRAYIVALTGLASRRDRDEAEQSGFDEFLTKPISFGKLGEMLKRLCVEKEGA